MKNGSLSMSALVGALVTAMAFGSGCQDSTASAQSPSKTSKATSTRPSKTGSSHVAKIVFVGKENACKCTKNRIAGSWAALQKALGRRRIPIERVQADRQRDVVLRYESMRSIMVLPAVYFLDVSGALVEMLQGEITAEQVRRVLRSRRAPPDAGRRR